jgi:hypothetical protein
MTIIITKSKIKKTKTTTTTDLQKLSYQIPPLGKSIKTSSSHHHYHQLCKHCKEWDMIPQWQRKISDPQLHLPTPPLSPATTNN